MQNLAFFNAILKEDYLGPIREQINQSTILLKRLRRNEEDVGGRAAIVPLHVGRNSGVGARSDGGTLPAAGRQLYDRAQYVTAYNYGRIQITGPTIKASRKDKYAFVKAVDSEIKGMVKDLKDDINRQLFMDRTGVLATCAVVPAVGAGGITTVTVDSSMYIQRGMMVDFVDAANVTPGGRRAGTAATGYLVTGRPSATTITVSGNLAAVGIAQTDLIVRQGNYLQEMMGLGGIVSNTNPGPAAPNSILVGNIDRTVAGNEFWMANVMGAGGQLRALTLDLMQQAWDASELEGGEVSMLMSTHDIRRRYLALVKADGRFVNTMEFDGGFKTIEFNEKPFFVDRHCQPNRIYFLDESSLELYRMSDFDWMDENGSVLDKVSGVDAYEAVLYKYATLGSNACNKNTLLTDLST